MAALVKNITNSGNESSVSSVTIEHTNDGDNVVVTVAIRGFTQGITSITFDGDALTQRVINQDTLNQVAVYSLDNATEKTGDVVVTYSGTVSETSVAAISVDGALNPATYDTDSQTGSDQDSTLTLTSPTKGGVVIDVVSKANSAAALNSSNLQTDIFNLALGTSGYVGSSYSNEDGEVSMTWEFDDVSNVAFAHASVSFLPATYPSVGIDTTVTGGSQTGNSFTKDITVSGSNDRRMIVIVVVSKDFPPKTVTVEGNPALLIRVDEYLIPGASLDIAFYQYANPDSGVNTVEVTFPDSQNVNNATGILSLYDVDLDNFLRAEGNATFTDADPTLTLGDIGAGAILISGMNSNLNSITADGAETNVAKESYNPGFGFNEHQVNYKIATTAGNNTMSGDLASDLGRAQISMIAIQTNDTGGATIQGLSTVQGVSKITF